jgi:hypothetical protein
VADKPMAMGVFRVYGPGKTCGFMAAHGPFAACS